MDVQKRSGGRKGFNSDTKTVDAPQSGLVLVRDRVALFRSVQTLSQESGVPPNRLRRLVAKELADNALDAGANCNVGQLGENGFFVEDDGPGIDGSPETIASIFSFGRPLTSSKLIRRPTRGAMGNGLRVVAGAVFASDGQLKVMTGGWELVLSPVTTGETMVASKKPKRTVGTRVEVVLGDGIPADQNGLAWAKAAIAAKGSGPIFTGKTSPYWFDSDSFRELLLAGGNRPVRQVIQDFDGFGVAAENSLLDKEASSVSHFEAEQLLSELRAGCKPSDPKKSLALLGKENLTGSYAKEFDELCLDPGRGNLSAQLPYSVEAWCSRAAETDSIRILVNRSPVTGETQSQRAASKNTINIFGCNLGYRFVVGRKPIKITVNVQIPYMPVTTAGKEPDLEHFIDSIRTTIESAAKKCNREDRDEPSSVSGLFPTPLPKGRPNAEAKAKNETELKRFADRVTEITSTVDFRPGARGICYILENKGEITKGEFDKAEGLITKCRKQGLLPLDFVSEDESRRADHLEMIDPIDASEFANKLVAGLDKWQDYSPVSFWANQPVYIQMMVEKIDLKSLFFPICKKFRVPLINARGWSDLHLRAAIMQRFSENEAQGRRPILLYCGDHDPVGMQIPETFPKHLAELEQAVGWSPKNLTMERFGLNADFIEKNDLLWIDGLETSGGQDLADPKHKQHEAAFVQDYIAKFGARKVEANALVVMPEEGRKLCSDAITKYLDLNAIKDYERLLAKHRQRARQEMPGAVQRYLAD